jgi:hypothetical protein
MAVPDNRLERRTLADLVVQVWGTDIEGLSFAQAAVARNVSARGALLLGLKRTLRCDDLVRIQHRDQSARFRVVWVKRCAPTESTEVAVQRIATERCPWQEAIAAAIAFSRSSEQSGMAAAVTA